MDNEQLFIVCNMKVSLFKGFICVSKAYMCKHLFVHCKTVCMFTSKVVTD